MTKTTTELDGIFPIPDDVKKRLGKGKYVELQEAIQLPLFSDLTRIIPNHLARSPLFAPTKRGKRTIYDREQLASREDVEILYTGKQLDMADQDVFLQSLELFNGKNLADREITVNRAEMLRAIGRDTGNQNYKWLEEVMHRLKTGTLTITSKRYKTELSLIDEWTRDEETGQYKISINPKIKVLFSNNEYGYINWPKRMAITNKIDLTKWLQTYISTRQKGEQRHRFETIKLLCGAKSRINDFRQDIEEALKELQRVKIIASYVIDKVGFDIVVK